MNDSPKREKVLTAAGRVFLKYGFRRATMGRIAKVAELSRPAVYLIFPSKEEAFNAVLELVLRRRIEDIRRGIDGFTDTRRKLLFAFEVWYVHPVQLAQISPTAKDLYDTHYEFAEDVTNMAFSVLARIVADLLEPAVRKQTRVELSADQVAEVLMGAIAGFKTTAKSTTELRRLIGNLLTVVLASLQGCESPIDSAQTVDTAAGVADAPSRSAPPES